VETKYTHPKGKGAGKYNGMKLASDWSGARIQASRQIRTNGGECVTVGMMGTVTGTHNKLNIAFDVCQHCGTVTHVRQIEYSAIELPSH
jgi:hypothetical protein